MSYEIRADYKQQFLLPPSIENWISEDHPARFIREYVETLDLEELGFKVRVAKEGRPNYSADMLLKVWIYGYFSKIYSTRQLERGCQEQMGLIWLTGMNTPDHNTLWRFFKDNKKVLKKLFRNCVRVAAQANLVGMVLHAVDGTKIKARVSKRGAIHKKEIELVLENLDELISETMEQIESTEGKEVGEYRLPEELKDKEKLREMIRDALDEMESIDREHLHPEEREARMMKNREKVEFAYNGQVVVDEKSGFIVGQEVVNEEADNHLLTKMVGEVEEILGGVAEETVADGGYASSEEIAQAEQRQYGILVHMPEEAGEYHTSKFKYDEKRDICICPREEELVYERNKKGKNKRYQVRVYRCKSYRQCHWRWECSQDKRGRHIEITEYHEAVQRQREKQASEAKQELMKKRKAIVECVFGQIKEAMGFRRFMVGGLEGVRAQWSMLCMTVNLKKMYKWWLKGELTFA